VIDCGNPKEENEELSLFIPFWKGEKESGVKNKRVEKYDWVSPKDGVNKWR